MANDKEEGKNLTSEWGLDGVSKRQNGRRWYQGSKAGNRQGTLTGKV